jgi:hypothetical protein
MKILQISISAVAITILLSLELVVTSCSKNDDPIVTPLPVAVVPLQDPLNGYLVASGFNQVTTSIVNDSFSEFGYGFTPSVNGKITAIVVKIPDANAALRVTIWDKATGGILRTETVNVTAANTEITNTINSLDLIQNKEYVISMNSDDYYIHSKTDNSNATYPFIVGDLKITSYLIRDGNQQVIPNSSRVSGYIGDCSFKFQK